MMLLQVSDLSKVYARGQKTFYAVKEANLQIRAGDFVIITGRSGSGKSTFLNMLAGLLVPATGTVLFDNVDLYSLGDEKLSALRNFRFGYIPQGSGLLANLTVLENISLPFYLGAQEGHIEDRAAFLLEEIGLSHLAQMCPASLSGGELRRVMIARALINSPDIVIADEPTSDLDPETTHDIMDLFFRINRKGMTLLIVTHELGTLKYGNRILSMQQGELAENMK